MFFKLTSSLLAVIQKYLSLRRFITDIPLILAQGLIFFFNLMFLVINFP